MIFAVAPWFDDHTGEFIATRQILDKIGRTLGYDVADYGSMPGIWRNLIYSVNDPPTSGYGYLSYLMAGQSIFSLIIAYVGGYIGYFFCARHTGPFTTPSK